MISLRFAFVAVLLPSAFALPHAIEKRTVTPLCTLNITPVEGTDPVSAGAVVPFGMCSSYDSNRDLRNALHRCPLQN